MNFNQLRYIIAVDHHRNFSRAADSCNVAQSTLSREIQRLEKEFGIMIFDRSRFPVVPTLKGQELIAQAKRILTEHDRFIQIAEKRKNEPAGSFRLGIHPGLAPYLLPLFAEALVRKYPALDLNIIEANQKEMVTYFADETLDAGLTIAPFFRDGFYEDPLFEEEFVLYINQKHPLAQKKTVDWKDIPPEELILHEDLKSFLLKSRSDVPQLAVPAQKIHKVAFESGSLETIRKIVDTSGGMTLLPHLSTLYMGGRRLKMVRKIASPALTRTIIMVTARGFEKNRVVKALKKEILAGVSGAGTAV